MGPGVNPDTSLPFHTDVQLIAQGYRDEEAAKRVPDERWTDEQRYAFGYIWKGSRQKAGDYAYAVNNILNIQQEQEQLQQIKEWSTANIGAGALGTAGAILAAPVGMADFLGDIIQSGTLGYIPEADGQITPFEFSQGVTSGISQHLNTEYGTLNEGIPIIGGKGWGDVYGYAWDNNGTLTGEWPGTALTRGEGGLYALTVSYNNTSSNKFNFIFNNNDGKQTADLTLSNSQLQSGNDWWVNGPSNKPAKCAPPKISGNTVTFTYEGSGTNVYVAGSMNGWSSSANKMTKSGSVFTCSMELPAGQYEYKFVVDSNWINDPANPQTVSAGSGNTNNYIVLPGMAAVTIPGTKGAAIQLPKELDCVTQEGATVRKAVSYKLATSDSNVTLSGTALTVKDAYTGTTVAPTASPAPSPWIWIPPPRRPPRSRSTSSTPRLGTAWRSMAGPIPAM